MDNFDLDSIKKFFPFTDKAVDVNGLLTCIIVYIIAAAIGGILIGFVPIIGWILGTLLELWFVIGVLLAFVELGRISAWFVMIICLREFMVTGIRMLAVQKGEVMAAKMIGKVKTTFQMIMIILFRFADPEDQVPSPGRMTIRTFTFSKPLFVIGYVVYSTVTDCVRSLNLVSAVTPSGSVYGAFVSSVASEA